MYLQRVSWSGPVLGFPWRSAWGSVSTGGLLADGSFVLLAVNHDANFSLERVDSDRVASEKME